MRRQRHPDSGGSKHHRLRRPANDRPYHASPDHHPAGSHRFGQMRLLRLVQPAEPRGHRFHPPARPAHPQGLHGPRGSPNRPYESQSSAPRTGQSHLPDLSGQSTCSGPIQARASYRPSRPVHLSRPYLSQSIIQTYPASLPEPALAKPEHLPDQAGRPDLQCLTEK